MTVSDDWLSTGRLFHTSGPATASAWLLNLTHVLDSRRSPQAAEPSDRRVDMVATAMHMSDVGWCKAVCGLIRQLTQLEHCSLSDGELMPGVCRFVVISLLAALQENNCSYRHQSFRVNRDRLWDHAVKFTRWQHPAVEHIVWFTVNQGDSVYIWIVGLSICSFLCVFFSHLS